MYISFNSPRFYSWENRPLGRWDVCRSQLEFRSTQLKHWGAKSLSLGHSRGGSTASAVPEPLVLSSRQPGHPPGTPLTRACVHTLLAQVGAGGRSWRLGPRKERRCPWLALPSPLPVFLPMKPPWTRTPASQAPSSSALAQPLVQILIPQESLTGSEGMMTTSPLVHIIQAFGCQIWSLDLDFVCD